MRDLRVSIIQRPLAWEDPVANRAAFDADLAGLAGSTDLVVLPEMFTTGFSMRSELIAEEDAADTLPWLLQQARDHDFAITGSLAVRSGGANFNRLFFVTPQGAVHHYDKRHLFRMAREQDHYAPGAERVVVSWRDWRICPMICYDLRFPVWSRNRDDYDLLLYVANWPEKRAHHWRALLIARAIENQACCIGVNRVGEDGNGIPYSGDSLVLAADGEILVDPQRESGSFTTALSAEHLTRYRSKFPCHLDADDFSIG